MLILPLLVYDAALVVAAADAVDVVVAAKKTTCLAPKENIIINDIMHSPFSFSKLNKFGTLKPKHI